MKNLRMNLLVSINNRAVPPEPVSPQLRSFYPLNRRNEAYNKIRVEIYVKTRANLLRVPKSWDMKMNQQNHDIVAFL